MKLDTDGDGKVSYEEYRASKEKAHERQFKKMDTNGDGFIDAT
jgi:Ca2+-binding EF-hand superfamily protein